MSFNHAVVWIDHRHAQVLHFDRENDELKTVNAAEEKEHLHHKANAIGDGNSPPHPDYFRDVIAAVGSSTEVLVAGPGSAKGELVKFAGLHAKNFAKRIGREDAENHPERRALTSYLGLSPLDLIDRNPSPFPLSAGNRLLLCSDGLYAALNEREIVQFLERDPQHMAEDLIALVVSKGRQSQDNLTVGILACESESM